MSPAPHCNFWEQFSIQKKKFSCLFLKLYRYLPQDEPSIKYNDVSGRHQMIVLLSPDVPVCFQGKTNNEFLNRYYCPNGYFYTTSFFIFNQYVHFYNTIISNNQGDKFKFWITVYFSYLQIGLFYCCFL